MQVEGYSENISSIYLHVQTSNEVAIEFYKSFGFETAEVRHRCPMYSLNETKCDGNHPSCFFRLPMF